MPSAAVSPIVWMRTSSSIVTRSMAPAAPRMPWRICPPSNAGPAGAEHAHRRSAEPSSTSPLVPMSTATRSAWPS